MPRIGHELTLLQPSLHSTPDAALSWSQDVFGNMIATASFVSLTDEFVILGKMEVEQCSPAWPVLLIDPAAHLYPFAYAVDDVRDLGSLATTDGISAAQPDHPVNLQTCTHQRDDEDEFAQSLHRDRELQRVNREGS